MAKHPVDRHASAEAFASELRDWLTGNQKRRSWIKWLLVVVVLVALAVVGTMIAATNDRDALIDDGIMHFDGHTRIVTDVNRTLPVTLEAWINPDQYKDENSQFIIGSDIPGKYGLGLAICGSQVFAEYISDFGRRTL